MRYKALIYLLVWIPAWSEVDNFVVAPFLPTPAGWVALEDDEYVFPSIHKDDRERSFDLQHPLIVVGFNKVAAFLHVGLDGGVHVAFGSISSFGASSLHVFMSMQC
jgi:hypothetical protein